MIILAFWIVFIILLLVALELSTNDNPPAWYSKVQSTVHITQMVTIFAQGHTAVTGIYLGRLAISSLHYANLAPKTWAEFFWSADHNWQGPVGIAQTLWGMFRLKRKVSSTFALFAVTSLVAFFTPIMLNFAYSRDPDATVEAIDSTFLKVLGPQTMSAVNIGLQLAVGVAAWTFDAGSRHTRDMYPNQIHGRLYSGVFVTASFGSNRRETATLPGLEVQGECKDLFADMLIPPSSPAELSTWCSNNNLRAQYDELESDMGANDTIVMAWCTDFNATSESKQNWMDNPNGQTTTVVAWMKFGGSRYRVFSCTSTTRIGSATTSQGSSRLRSSYDNFEVMSLLSGDSPPSTHMSFFPPIYAVFVGLSQQFTSTEAADIVAVRSGSLRRMFGYGYSSISNDTWSQGSSYGPPPMETIGEQLDVGVLHMAAAIHAVGAQTNKSISFSYDRVLSSTKMYKDKTGAIATYVLFATWMLLLLYSTARMYRPTFGSSLDSYTAARLLADMPHLVEDYCAGVASDNLKLRSTFQRVGDNNSDEDIGHIASGGQGLLDVKRSYGAKTTALRSIS
jgi:hypothetical protein